VQVLTGLDIQDKDVDQDQDIRPQTGECIRKEYRRLTAEEVRLYQAALNTMKNREVYGMLVRHHRPRNSPAAHFGPAFFCWHRYYLLMYEFLYPSHRELILPVWGTVSTSGLYLVLFSEVRRCRYRWTWSGHARKLCR